jgi:hypothetical protein
MTTGDIAILKVDRLPDWKKGDRVHISSIHQCKHCGEIEIGVIHLEHMDEADFEPKELEITS